MDPQICGKSFTQGNHANQKIKLNISGIINRKSILWYFNSGSTLITSFDHESSCPGSSPDSVAILFMARSLQWSDYQNIHSAGAVQLYQIIWTWIVTGACSLNDGLGLHPIQSYMCLILWRRLAYASSKWSQFKCVILWNNIHNNTSHVRKMHLL